MAKSKFNVSVGDVFGHWTILEVLGNGGKCLCQCDCAEKTVRKVRTDNLIYGKSKSCGCMNKVHVGDVYSRLTVLKLNVKETPSGIKLHKCRCKCGNITYVSSTNLKSGHTKSCGCYNKEQTHLANFKDIVGNKYSHLTVIFEYKDRDTWKCVCSCDCDNKIIIVRKHDILTGNTKSCGCERLKFQTMLGMSATKFGICYTAMLDRCYNPRNSAYKNYGGRGIFVCDRWLDFKNFYEDMYISFIEHVEEYGAHNTSLDRYPNNDGNYEPSNCRWATWEEQARNKRNTWYITYEGEVRPAKEWADILHINYSTICNRKTRLKTNDPELLFALNSQVADIIDNIGD